jgi:hypothetical protein
MAMSDDLRAGDNQHAHSVSQVLARIRKAGWKVAIHNDYSLNGKNHTFWLFTHKSGIWAKGEGRSDRKALAEAERQIKSRSVELGAARVQVEKEICGWLRDVVGTPPAQDTADRIAARNYIPVKVNGKFDVYADPPIQLSDKDLKRLDRRTKFLPTDRHMDD